MKLSLRDLFWLTLVAAFATGWWIDHARLTEKIESEASFRSIGNHRVDYIEGLNTIITSGPVNRSQGATSPKTQQGPAMRDIMEAMQRRDKEPPMTP
jgi:hypothetical protein